MVVTSNLTVVGSVDEIVVVLGSWNSRTDTTRPAKTEEDCANSSEGDPGLTHEHAKL